MKTRSDMHKLFAAYTPGKTSLKDKFKKNAASEHPIGIWTKKRQNSCYICKQFEETYARYLDTFFVLYKKDEEFREKVKNSKGFCIPHFGDLCREADRQLSDKEKEDFYPAMFALMESNMERIQEDVNWLVEKFDYRNKDADWKTSKDAIQRGMQKLQGGLSRRCALQDGQVRLDTLSQQCLTGCQIFHNFLIEHLRVIGALYHVFVIRPSMVYLIIFATLRPDCSSGNCP